MILPWAQRKPAGTNPASKGSREIVRTYTVVELSSQGQWRITRLRLGGRCCIHWKLLLEACWSSHHLASPKSAAPFWPFAIPSTFVRCTVPYGLRTTYMRENISKQITFDILWPILSSTRAEAKLAVSELDAVCFPELSMQLRKPSQDPSGTCASYDWPHCNTEIRTTYIEILLLKYT